MGPVGEFRRWGGMRESSQQYPGIERAARTFEDASNGDHADDAMIAHEAMFDEAPLFIPAEQPGVNLEALECLKIAAKLGDGVSHHRERLLLSCNAKGPRSRTSANGRYLPAR